jgi:hypothetical protein
MITPIIKADYTDGIQKEVLICVIGSQNLCNQE